MARPLKDGVDYWNEDCYFYSNNKIRLLRSEFGANGMYFHSGKEGACDMFSMCRVWKYKSTTLSCFGDDPLWSSDIQSNLAVNEKTYGVISTRF